MAFKVGDKVRCVDGSGLEEQLTANRVYTVSSVHSLHYDNKGIKIDDITTMFVASRFVLADEPKPILVPVDPACVPDGWEAVRVGVIQPGENGVTKNHAGGYEAIPEEIAKGKFGLIVRKHWQASISIPPGWWVYQNCPERWFATDMEPYQSGKFWCRANGSQVWEVTHLNFTPPPDGQPRQVQ